MSSEDIEQLAHAYVQGTATETEMAAIERLLKDRGAAADLFALACQIELELLDTFPPGQVAPRPVTRRNWLQIAAAFGSSIWKPTAAAAAGATIGVMGTRGVEADEIRALRAEVATLSEFQTAVRKYLDAFRLAHDQPNELGPAATLSDFDTVDVAGVVDPDLIERVEVSWGDPGAKFVEVFARGKSDLRGIGTFVMRHRFLSECGKLYRVVVKATPRDEHRAELLELGRDERWLNRESLFVGTPAGLCPAVHGLMQLNVPLGAELTSDMLELTGIASERGSVMISFRSADGKLTLVLGPTDVESQRPWPASAIDLGRFPNGEGTIMAAWLPQAADAWRGLDERAGEAIFGTPARTTEPPARLRIVRIPVRLDLAPAEFRAARWILEQGGIVGPHGGDDIRELRELVDRHLSVQRADFRNAAISDLTPLRYCRELQGLHLPNALVDDVSLVGLAERHPQLKWIVLGGTRVTDEGVVGDVARLSHLSMLNLSQNARITDRSVVAICRNLKELTDLDLSGTGVTSLVGVSELRKLKRLRVARTAVPDEQIVALRAARSDLAIER